MRHISSLKDWNFVTPGERLFATIYKDLAIKLEANLTGPHGSKTAIEDAESIVSGEGLLEFFRLCLAMEFLHRTLNETIMELTVNSQARVPTIKRRLRDVLRISFSNDDWEEFTQQAIQAAKAVIGQKLTGGMKNAIHASGTSVCYLCGNKIRRGAQNDAEKATVEHIWPEFLGGTSDEENLTLACGKCNSTRQHAYSWAWLPVQSVYESKDSNGSTPLEIRIALGLERLIRHACGKSQNSRRTLTLKEAARELGPVLPRLTLEEGRRYTFFELVALTGDKI